MMEPRDIAYYICKCYITDLKEDVDPALWSLVSGYNRARNLAGLTSCSCHFDKALHSIKDWTFLRQVEAFFKKNANLANKEVCKEAAKLSFEKAERQCSETNIRLNRYVGRYYLLDDTLQLYLKRMAHYISSVLGDIQPFLIELPHLVKVTSGATAHSSRRNSLPQLKLKMRLFCTKRASKYVKYLYHYFGFGPPRIMTAHSNRVELVPKNWKTDRTIACEPEGNLPLQLAFDTYAKRRLRLFGIDLSDQSANQNAAKEASVNGELVTVDFSSASDTVSFNTVSLVFPVDWFNYLHRVRSPFYRGVFGRGCYSKFSSMGNGTTFTIETLLFAAACYAVGSKKSLVYGDDVIIEKDLFNEFHRLTSFLGFTINEEKTFTDGPFRESCGGDFFNGINVTPVYVRQIDKRKALLCHLVNTLMGIALPNGELQGFLESIILSEKLPYVPYQESTIAGVWIDPANAQTKGILNTRWRFNTKYNRWKLLPKRAANHSWLGKCSVDDTCVFTFKAYIAKCKARPFVDSRGYYLWFLHKNSQVLFGAPWQVSALERRGPRWIQTSSAPVYDHRYVRKRVCWVKPANGLPFHLYWWKEPSAPLATRKGR